MDENNRQIPETVQPIADPDTEATETVQPVAETVHPTAETVQPTAEPDTEATETIQPVAETIQPVAEPDTTTTETGTLDAEPTAKPDATEIALRETNNISLIGPPIDKTNPKPAKSPVIPIAAILGAGVAVVGIAVLLIFLLTANSRKYNKAFDLIDSGDYEEAYQLFEELGDYKNAEEELEKFHYVPTKVEYTNTDDGDSSTTIISFNKQNLPKKMVETYQDGTIDDTYEFTYDKNGNCTKIIETDIDGDTYTYEYTYDKNGNCTKMVETDSDGDTCTYEYTYDKKGNCTKEAYTSYYDFTYTCEYTYDKNGNLTKEVYTNSDDNISTTEYTYDKNGNLTKEKYTTSYGYNHTYEYTYDKKGNMIKEVYSDSSNYTYTCEYTYDKNGNCTKEVCTYSDGDIETTVIKYKFVYIPFELTEEEFEELFQW